MKPTMAISEPIKSNWNYMWWILGTIFIPISLPYLILQVLGHFKEKNSRKELPGKVVLITGASSGLGEALAHSFYAAGCKVILAARRLDELKRVQNDLEDVGLVSCCWL